MRKIQKALDQSQKAAQEVNILPFVVRKKIVRAFRNGLLKNVDNILKANAKDLAIFNTQDPMYDRLLLTKARIEGMAKEQEGLLSLSDPIGQQTDKRERNGLVLYRQRVPLGVIGVVYESRPNVTMDVAGICLLSGNAVLLRGGREAKNSYLALMQVIHAALKSVGVIQNAVQMLDPEDRDVVQELITAREYVDLVIPRGSQKFIEYVRTNATVPTIETGAGVCHTFVDASANLKLSTKVIFNAKTQRPSVCNALDTALVHSAIANKFLPLLAKELFSKEVIIYADSKSYKILKSVYPKNLLKHAQAVDFGREFLSQQMSIKVVDNIQQAISHIAKYSSKHSEAILSNSPANQKLFQQQVDAAVVYVNASTRFSDGAVFGLGSEIGNSTQKLHARGPMGPAEITTYKWMVTGKYSVR